MNLSIRCKTILARVLSSAGIPHAVMRKRSGAYVILMYHRVLSPGPTAPPPQPGMYVAPDTFEMHLVSLRNQFRLVHLSDVPSIRGGGQGTGKTRPACVLTFDDGWADFFESAYPVLKRHKAPATVFLPTGYVGTNNRFWTERLGMLLATTHRVAIPDAPPKMPTDALWARIARLPGTYEKRLESAIRILKEREQEEIDEAIEGLGRVAGDGNSPQERQFLSWEEVREMRSSGLVAFGSHSHTHRILVRLGEVEIRDELIRSREILLREGAVDPSFIPFCYPNGSWNERIEQLVRETGYHASVSTGNGWNREGSSPFGLKRVPIHQDMTASMEMFGCRLAGIL